ncbi:hypothetical protein [Sphingomonas lacusdianchii]|uniref:hypothetical protein n=1 Tax=Sphingomonas lacusdianchii TaxID=2917992 RepID=UPI001F55C910|nr:hypothetical protein [Sphingomonas sp. JXJ CY 53]
MRFFAISVTLACLYAATAKAEPDQCKDVLRNGTFRYEEYKSNSYFQQILYSRFLESTFENSKTDTSLGIGVPIGKAVMGSLNYGKDEYEAMRRSVERTNFQKIERINELSTMLYSGDQGILDAWSECIKKFGGGVSVRFDPLTYNTVRLVVEYLSQGVQHKAKLSAPIIIGNIDPKRTTNPYCLKKGAIITAGSPCRTTITLPDAWTTLSVDVNAIQGSASAFLPSRIRLVEHRQRVPVESLSGEYFRRGNVREASVFNLTSEQAKEGWMLDASTATHAVGKVFDNGRNNNSCYESFISVRPYSAEYGYNVISHTRGHGGWTVGCRGTYYLEMFRRVWEPDKTLRPPAFPSV